MKKNKQEAFLYLWRDSRYNKYYLGIHLYKDGDDYAHSSSIMESFSYSERPSYMKRRILKWGSYDEMHKLEQRLLEKKSKSDRYYNVDKTPNARNAGRLGGLANKGKEKTKKHRGNISQSNKGQDSHWLVGDVEQKRKNLSTSMKGNKNFNIKKPGVRQTHRNGMLKYWEDVRAGRIKRKGY